MPCILLYIEAQSGVSNFVLHTCKHKYIWKERIQQIPVAAIQDPTVFVCQCQDDFLPKRFLDIRFSLPNQLVFLKLKYFFDSFFLK